MSDAARKASSAAKDAYAATASRLRAVQAHLAARPRSGRLQGKVCIVTGVGSKAGIGRAAALQFAHEGARHLYLLDFNVENLPELEQDIRGKYADIKVTTFQGDAADEELVREMCERALREEGRLDVFFANAGVAHPLPLHQIEPDTFMDILRVNTLSCFLAVKHASTAMKHADPAKGKELSGGSIILTASVAGLRSGAGMSDYSASKAAVINLAQTSSYQLSGTNIRVNALCPGLIETGMTQLTFDAARARGRESKIGQLNPLRRYGVADEIASVALFLASDEASYVNGAHIPVDGGLSASHPIVPGKAH